MKKDMFYNYDRNIKKNNLDSVLSQKYTEVKPPNINTGMNLVTNIKGEVLGVCVKKGNPINLCFFISGTIDGNYNIGCFINSAKLEIFNSLSDTNNEAIITLIPNSVNPVQNNQISFEFVDSENLLKQDLYKLKLTVEIDGEEYVLFSEHDGFLEIL